MKTSKRGRSRFCGYRTPFSDEIHSERAFVEHLNKVPSDQAEFLPIERQLRVFEREKLDLLALDANGVPSIFEFKRDIAGYQSVSQLLTYGSYIADWSLSRLKGYYNVPDGRSLLDEAFYERFRKRLPRQLPRQVNLILAAFEFSLACDRAIEFIEQSGGPIIGKLRVQTIWDRALPIPQTEYHWVRRPVPTRPLKTGVEPREHLPHYFLLQNFYELPLNWENCMFNRWVPIPEEWDIENNPIAPRSGVFVSLTGIQTNFEHELDSGLVGYGITNDAAFDLIPRLGKYELNTEDFRRMRKDKFFVVPVDWVWIRPDNDPAPISVWVPTFSPLCRLSDAFLIRQLKRDLLGIVEAVDEDSPEDSPDGPEADEPAL
jgi:hypothetical protein